MIIPRKHNSGQTVPGKQASARLLSKVVGISSYLPTVPTYQHTHTPSMCKLCTCPFLSTRGPDMLDLDIQGPKVPGLHKVPLGRAKSSWGNGYLLVPSSWPVKMNPTPGGRRCLGNKQVSGSDENKSPVKTRNLGGLS